MTKKLRIYRGPYADLPDLLAGEPAYTTDTQNLYIGTDTTTNIEFYNSSTVASLISTSASTITTDLTADIATALSTAETYTDTALTTAKAYTDTSLTTAEAYTDTSITTHKTASGDHAASVVSFTATGDISSTNVQTAIAELDTEKAALSGAAFTGNVSVTGTLTAALTGNADTATKLATARTIALTGDGTASISFDGSANVSGALTLASSGVTAGTYNSVTVNAKGLVTAGSSTTNAITILNDTKTSGTAGGTFTSGSWQTRTLNNAVINQIGVTLSSNQFTLPVGTYEVEADAPALQTNSHKIRLQNITDATTVIMGTNSYASNSYGGCNRSFLTVAFTITAAKVFELQHYCSVTVSTNGFGYACSLGNEIYAQVKIVKIG